MATVCELRQQLQEVQQRDQEAMELSEQQNEAFMTQLEEKDAEIAALKQQLIDQKEHYDPTPKFKVGDVAIFFGCASYDGAYPMENPAGKFLEVTKVLKKSYRVRQIKNQDASEGEFQPEDYDEVMATGMVEAYTGVDKQWKIPTMGPYEYIPHKNLSKQLLERCAHVAVRGDGNELIIQQKVMYKSGF